MPTSRWEPFRDLNAMEDRVRSMLGDVLVSRGEQTSEPRSVPPVDVAETAREFVLRFDVPGVPRDAVTIELENGVLTVSGERAAAPDEAGERYHRRERAVGTFGRSVPLPPGVDEDRIRADLRDGVLEIRVAKPEAPQPKRIKIGS